MNVDMAFAHRFVQAANYTKGRKTRIDLVVIHDMEAPEKLQTAENVAAYFARSSTQASAHYCVDANSVVQCVREEDTAWHAPGANANGIGIELAGYAKQTKAEWQDAYSNAMLSLASALVADICRRHDIPARFVDADGLKNGLRGITTHRAVTAAFKKSTHTDPGPNFPLGEFIRDVAARMA